MSSNIANEQPMSKRQRIDAVDSSKKGAFSAISNGATTTTTTTDTSKHHISGQTNQPPDILPITKTEHKGTTNISSLISELSSSKSVATDTTTPTKLIHRSSLSQSPSDELDNAAACNLSAGIRSNCATEFPDLLRTSPDIASTSSSTHPVPGCSHKHITTHTTTAATTITNSNETSPRLSSRDSANSFSRLNNVDEFQLYLMQQCLCDIDEQSLRRAFATYYYTDPNGSKYTAPMMEWPAHQLIQFLSNMDLLFEVYLNQNAKGEICTRIMQVCDALLLKKRDADDDCYEIIDGVFQLAEYNNKIVQYLAIKVLANCLLIVKDKEPYCEDLLLKLMDNLVTPDQPTNHLALGKVSFILGIIQHIMEWKDIKKHPLDDQIVLNGREVYNDSDNENFTIPLNVPTIENNYFAVQHGVDDANEADVRPTPPTDTNHLNERHHPDDNDDDDDDDDNDDDDDEEDEDNDGEHRLNVRRSPNDRPGQRTTACHLEYLSDWESFDSNELKISILNLLKIKWDRLVESMAECVTLLQSNRSLSYIENTVVTFLTLWERIISVDTCIEYESTLPFHALLVTFEAILIRGNLPIQIYKQILTLFSASLCYTTTLALQPEVPQYTNKLAEELFNSVLNLSIFSSLPTHEIEPKNNINFIGYKHTTIVYAPSDRLARSFNGENAVNGDVGNGHNGDDDHDHDDDNDGDDDDDDEDVLLNENFNKSIDFTLLQKLVLLILKAIAVTIQSISGGDSSDSSMDSCSSTSSTAETTEPDWSHAERVTREAIEKLQLFLRNKLNFLPETHFSKVIIRLFSSQDDYLLEAMLCMLGTTIAFLPRQPPFGSAANRQQQSTASNDRPQYRMLIDMICPVYTFLEFLELINYDMHTMLDYLITHETCFLLYFLRFLKYIRGNWTVFQNQCSKWHNSSSNSMRTNSHSEQQPYKRAMDVLITLRVKLERLVFRNQFPYNISPLVFLMHNCENLYDGNTFGLC